MVVLVFRPNHGLKEGLWCVECLWAPKSFPAQVSAHLENKNIRPGRQLIPKRNLRTENSLNQTQQPGPGTHTKTTTTNNSWSVAKSDQYCTSLDTSKVSQVININAHLDKATILSILAVKFYTQSFFHLSARRYR